jgi:bifunctional non-homologous end joining protein LigD
MQVYIPLNTQVTYEKTKEFARDLATLMVRQFPELVVSKMEKTLRKGKVFVDWSQNDDKKTTINVYSLRARERPTVSTPVTWEEITAALKNKKSSALVFETSDVLKRVEKQGDLFAPVLTLKQKLPAVRSLKENFPAATADNSAM